MERITPVPCNVIREKYGLEKDSYILYVGRISPEKGPQDLLEAYQKLQPKERLVLTGPALETEFGKEMIRKIDADPVSSTHLALQKRSGSTIRASWMP